MRGTPFSIFVLAVAAACAPAPSTGGEGPDAMPIRLPQRPEGPKTGNSGTTDGCEGVPEKGYCDKVTGVAITCNLVRQQRAYDDCSAKGQECFEDDIRGAVCRDPSTAGGGTGGTDGGIGTSPGCGTLTAAGACEGNTAVYCDVETDTKTQKVCGAGEQCLVDKCVAGGAFCCKSDVPPTPDPACATLDYYGECGGTGGTVARYCDSAGVLHQDDCAAKGQRCERDTCDYGAACCGASTGGAPGAAMCAALGYQGKCEGNTVAYCQGSTDADIVRIQCDGGKTCQERTCYTSGAYCCDAGSSPVSACGSLTWAGTCEGNQFKFCDGEMPHTIDCAASGQVCKVNDCYQGGAACCNDGPPQNECQRLGGAGECTPSNSYRYCNNENMVVEYFCAADEQCQFNTCAPAAAACCLL
jgi:hypothetical protein